MKCGKIEKLKPESCKDKKRKNSASKKIVKDSKKSKFIKRQEASRLSSSLERKTPPSKIYLVGPNLF